MAVTAQLEASQVELTVLHRNGAFFDLTHIHFCVPATIEPTGQLATLTSNLAASMPGTRALRSR